MEEGVGMLFECGIASDSAVENPFTGEGELDFEAVEALGYVLAVGVDPAEPQWAQKKSSENWPFGVEVALTSPWKNITGLYSTRNELSGLI